MIHIKSEQIAKQKISAIALDKNKTKEIVKKKKKRTKRKRID